MANITYDADILLEITSIMLMYRVIKDRKRDRSNVYLVKASEEIANSLRRYIETKDKDTQHAIVLEKYKKDIIDNLAREGRVDIPYNGLEKMIELSCGTPRTILCMLKSAFNNQFYNTGKVPFEDGRKLTVRSQRVGIERDRDRKSVV